MNEGVHAVLILDGEEYELSHWKITADLESYFCYDLEAILTENDFPKVKEDESYFGRLVVNGDALWYFPWIWFDKVKKKKITASVHGAIFCPFGLTEDEETKFDAMNMLVASDTPTTIPGPVWCNVLLIFADWLKAKSIPQYEEFEGLAEESRNDGDEDE